jgi:hypothetical protein
VWRSVWECLPGCFRPREIVTMKNPTLFIVDAVVALFGLLFTLQGAGVIKAAR